jgi:trans-aconitate 2-methyltransferase
MERTPGRIEWDARAYHTLSKPQQRWGERVLDALPLAGDELVLDLGCGTGLLTEKLLERLPRGRVVAIDRSQNMLDRARLHLARVGERVRFVEADLPRLPEDLRGVDAVFSTATFHWVPDHAALFAAIAATLRPGGRLVAQLGGAGNVARIEARIEVLMRDALFADAFVGFVHPWNFPDPRLSEERLREAGFVDVETELVDAPTPFEGRGEYREFLERVILGAHLERLDADRRTRFLDWLCERGSGDDPPWVCDYVRLNLRAVRS